MTIPTEFSWLIYIYKYNIYSIYIVIGLIRESSLDLSRRSLIWPNRKLVVVVNNNNNNNNNNIVIIIIW